MTSSSPVRQGVPSRPARVPTSPYRWIGDGMVHDWFFKLLLLVAPIQSVLLTPVQGTTPAFLMVLASVGVLVGGDRHYLRLLVFAASFVLAYSLYMALSLSGYLIDYPNMSGLHVIRQIYIYGELKQTHVTQGLYLYVALLFTFLIYEYYQEAFLKFAYFGILALALYGFYEFIYYAIYHENGDWISNRNFGNLDQAAAGAGSGDFVTGSAVQPSNLFGAGFMRLKSLTGEPSMYALTVTPFAVYAFARRWWLLFGILTLSVLLSTSTTGIIGLIVGLSYAQIRQRQDFILYIAAAVLTVALLYFTAEPVRYALDKLLFQKLDTYSGNQRLTYFINHASVPFDGNPVRALFGLGFGTVRGTDMLSNLLANIGILGALLYTATFLLPCFLLRRIRDHDAVVATILSIFVMEVTTVSEYAYLPPWFMVALAYSRLRDQRQAARTAAPAATALRLPGRWARAA